MRKKNTCGKTCRRRAIETYTEGPSEEPAEEGPIGGHKTNTEDSNGEESDSKELDFIPN